MDFGTLQRFSGYIYLNRISEPRDNGLRLLIDRCRISDAAGTLRVGGVALPQTRRIDVDDSLPYLQCDFEWYIAYAVRNESYVVADDYDVASGTRFQIYTRSRFLDFINVGTIATEAHSGPFRHYGINALNHIIDVVATDPPVVTERPRAPRADG